MSVTLTLRQEKTVLTDGRYRVVSWITGGTAGLVDAFKVDGGLDGASETYDGVLTLGEQASLPVNDLLTFNDFVGHFDRVTLPCTLSILNAPEEWITTYFTTAVFTVTAISAPVGGHKSTLTIASAVPFPAIADNLSWRLMRGFTLLQDGTAGQCRQAIPVVDRLTRLYRRRHWTAIFTDVTSAENHAAAVKAYVGSLVNMANANTDLFTGVEEITY